jgi:hypothetical protein
MVLLHKLINIQFLILQLLHLHLDYLHHLLLQRQLNIVLF